MVKRKAIDNGDEEMDGMTVTPPRTTPEQENFKEEYDEEYEETHGEGHEKREEEQHEREHEEQDEKHDEEHERQDEEDNEEVDDEADADQTKASFFGEENSDDEEDRRPKKILWTIRYDKIRKPKRAKMNKLSTKFDVKDTKFVVEPSTEWEKLTRYKSFNLQAIPFTKTEYVFVNGEGTLAPKNVDILEEDEAKFWPCRIMEIRGSSPSNAWVRIAWLYTPDELPGGRKEYHGKDELVMTDHFDIIDPQTVSGHAEVTHFTEVDDAGEDAGEDLTSYYWRQSYSFARKQYSPLRTHCKCKQPFNPDLKMIGCEGCKAWLHTECLENAIREIHGVKDDDDTFMVTIASTTNEEGKLIHVASVIDGTGKTWEEPIKCLCCDHLIS